LVLEYCPQGHEQHGRIVRHGSSLDLVSKCHVLLNEEFSETDPEKDFEKWLKKGAQPYFLAIIEPSLVMSCCLRCLFDGEWGETPSQQPPDSGVCKRRLVVDYVFTLEEHQGSGYAGHLLDLVLR